MKEKFSHLEKEIDFQEVQEAQRIPKKLDPRRNTPRHIIIKLPNIKDKENLKSSKRNGESYLQGSSHKTIKLISQKKPHGQEAAGKKYSKS